MGHPSQWAYAVHFGCIIYASVDVLPVQSYHTVWWGGVLQSRSNFIAVPLFGRDWLIEETTKVLEEEGRDEGKPGTKKKKN